MRFALLIKLLVVISHFDFARSHTHKKCPNGLILNEVFTFGQQRNLMTSGQPFIEIARSTNEEYIFRLEDKMRPVEEYKQG